MTLDEQIAILQAAKEGQEIEYLTENGWKSWWSDTFAFDRFDYRIKQNLRELWAAISQYETIDYWSTDKQTLVDLTDKDPRSWKIVKFREVIE